MGSEMCIRDRLSIFAVGLAHLRRGMITRLVLGQVRVRGSNRLCVPLLAGCLHVVKEPGVRARRPCSYARDEALGEGLARARCALACVARRAVARGGSGQSGAQHV